jgi:hypothetical protein
MPARWLAALAALALTAAPAALAAPARQAPPGQTPQVLFAALIVNDPATTPAVRTLLGAGAAFVAPQPAFADLTGDGRMDAIVQVRIPGAAGTIAVYAFSTDGVESGDLRAIFRRQSLYRGGVRVAGATLTVLAARYATGDDLCCPAARTETDYRWDADRRALRRSGDVRTIRLRR